ncbi:hypothetical protein HL658_09980 [Azospirillum sp. RWY-5-1]|uniref:Mu-like prophage I protein n=1 Tax=Azospirillum oleiclasticum TaxID=2735135 RepID=A0ABX2T777_9PROT|nr:phage protease [Azospirillum oleiclasticum]NYZ12881.1 hypothetical protein [Azospirillum oleiclasticum]NYZ20041.1 hypothetical protein [Azospirillum oleiclasticum]
MTDPAAILSPTGAPAHGLALCASDRGGAAVIGALAAALPDAGGGAPDWIKVAPLGTVTGRDGRGPYVWGDRAQAERIVAASLAYAAGSGAGGGQGIDLMVDYNHAYDLAAMRGTGEAPAAGWIKALEVRDDGIWGRVDWTARAAAQIAGREYRYFSPTFEFDPATRTVTRIVRGGLVTHPNFNLTALAAAGDPTDMDETLKAFLKALGLPETTARDAALASAARLASANGPALTALAAAAGLDATADAAAVTARVVQLASARSGLDQVAAAVGLAAGAETPAVLAAVTARPATADPAKYVPMEQYLATAAALTALQKETAAAGADAAIDAAVTAGKITPATRDHFKAVYAANPAGWPALAAALPVIVPPGGGAAPPGKPAGTAGQPDETEATVFRLLGIDTAAAMKTKAELGM